MTQDEFNIIILDELRSIASELRCLYEKSHHIPFDLRGIQTRLDAIRHQLPVAEWNSVGPLAEEN